MKQKNKESQFEVHPKVRHFWVPKEPLHPFRQGHKIIAEKLSEELKKIID